MVGSVARRAVPVAVGALDARQEPVERGHQVIVRACPDLDDDKTGRRVRDEDREEPVTLRGSVGHEVRTGRRQVVETAAAPRPDGQLTRLYGKMLRIASRIRPSPPPTGADS